MRNRSRIAAGLAALGMVVGSTGLALGGDHGHDHPKSAMATPHTLEQAGYPQCVSPISMTSYNEHYSGYYVGGGHAFGGSAPCPHQGTWGWDYTPFRPISPRIFLGWTNGRRYQGGTGAYRTDGPKPIEHVKEAVHAHLGVED